ncbi:hypothetical protein Pcinc_038483 [Petrolisthes cinctipes]|uniref:Uncharacterized protein n=1 Tax=Petrolisthes cinctipes TaxID=88211 RepID=A0AAE1BRR6_PETCI|nr:hypothetical protein Pcinc_038483 [Petrolisthes cinctipes]
MALAGGGGGGGGGRGGADHNAIKKSKVMQRPNLVVVYFQLCEGRGPQLPLIWIPICRLCVNKRRATHHPCQANHSLASPVKEQHGVIGRPTKEVMDVVVSFDGWVGGAGALGKRSKVRVKKTQQIGSERIRDIIIIINRSIVSRSRSGSRKKKTNQKHHHHHHQQKYSQGEAVAVGVAAERIERIRDVSNISRTQTQQQQQWWWWQKEWQVRETILIKELTSAGSGMEMGKLERRVTMRR